MGENFKFLSKFPCLHIYLHLGFQELDGKPASPTPVIVASHTANKEEKSLLELEVDLDNLELEDIDTTDINLDEDILDD